MQKYERFERTVADANSSALVEIVSVFSQETGAELKVLVAADGKVPILILHGDADQGMALEASAVLLKEMIAWANLKVCKKAVHGEQRGQNAVLFALTSHQLGFYLTNADQLRNDLRTFAETMRY